MHCLTAGDLMPIHNTEIAAIFNEYADLLEIDGANQYRVRAYRTAARNISNLSQSAAAMVQNGKDLSKLAGIGKDLAGKIAEIVETGTLSEFEKIKQKLPAGLLNLTQIEGMGPKRIATLHQELGITSMDELEKAAQQNKIRDLPGFAAKTEKAILEEIERLGKQGESRKRLKLSVAEDLAQPLVGYLRQIKGVKRVEAAGSYRRGLETVGDLDILVTHTKTSKIMDRFVNYEDVQKVISEGKTRSTVVMRYGLHVDLRAVASNSYGSALHYFTGSKAHSVAIRQIGVKKGLKINEYGVFKGEKRIAGKEENDVYEQVGLPYIEPELRENQGEIEAARDNRLPKILSVDNIKGDLHAHTKATDGRSTLEQMARAAKAKGYQYLAITEHSKHVTVAKGLDTKRLKEQVKEIDRLNDKLNGPILLKGIEVDILEDGSLDLPDDLLQELDVVVCAVHSKFNLSRDKQTDRIIRALRKPYFTILAHPTGRMINEREPYDLDMERLIEAAKGNKCALELNAQPDRLDLRDIYCRMAKEAGVPIVISTDAHSTEELDFMRFGVLQARRGWLESGDVLNTKSLKGLQKAIKR